MSILKQLVEETESADKPIEEWLKANNATAFIQSQTAKVKPMYDHEKSLMNTIANKGDTKGYYVFDGKILLKKGFDSISLSSQVGPPHKIGHPWEPLPESNAYLSSKIQHAVLSGYSIPNCHGVPNVKDVNMYFCRFESLEGIEKLDKVETLVLNQPLGFSVGILRLLKMPNLKKISFGIDGTGIWQDSVRKLVQKQLDGDRDIPDLMDQIMDLGKSYKEFAKL